MSVAEIRVAVVDGAERICEGNVDAIGMRVGDSTWLRVHGAGVAGEFGCQFDCDASGVESRLYWSAITLSIAFLFGVGQQINTVRELVHLPELGPYA